MAEGMDLKSNVLWRPSRLKLLIQIRTDPVAKVFPSVTHVGTSPPPSEWDTTDYPTLAAT